MTKVNEAKNLAKAKDIIFDQDNIESVAKTMEWNASPKDLGCIILNFAKRLDEAKPDAEALATVLDEYFDGWNDVDPVDFEQWFAGEL